MKASDLRLVITLGLCIACGRQPSPAPGRASAEAVPSNAPRALAANAPILVEPTRLTQLGVSAYQVSLALDGDVVYLLTSNAAYRLLPGQPAQGIQLDLGLGPVLTQSAFIFWSKRHIWSAPKQGGVARQLSRLPHQPQYFVASGDRFAWIDLGEDGIYSIQTLADRTPRILVSSRHELSALSMVNDAIYFVERPTDASWRLGTVGIDGAAAHYGEVHQGRRPSMLATSDDMYYFDVDATEIRKVDHGVEREQTLLAKFVCSPMHVSDQIFCGCVEGIFEVSKLTRQPRVLSASRSGPIASVASNAQMVVWVVDVGPDQLAVDMLPRAAVHSTTHR